jgi:hypothetical protein
MQLLNNSLSNLISSSLNILRYLGSSYQPSLGIGSSNFLGSEISPCNKQKKGQKDFCEKNGPKLPYFEGGGGKLLKLPYLKDNFLHVNSI